MRAPAWAAAALLLLCAAPARALDVRERYEEALIAAALAKHHLVVDDAPEGKTIERVIVEAHKIILPGDFPLSKKIPWTWLNYLHVRTREYIVRQELLFHAGEPFARDVFDETGRNLRSMFILSVARLVVCRGSTPDQVVILVLTKDNWTLRLNTNFQIDQDRLDNLSFSISENNLAGRNKTIAFDFALDPGRYAIGLAYTDPRVLGSRLQLSLNADVFLNRATNHYEGATAAASIGRPLFSLRSEWSWLLALTYLQDIFRGFSGGSLLQLAIGDDKIPDTYKERIATANLTVTRSWGVRDKVNLTVGLRYTSAQYTLTDDFPTDIAASSRATFVANLPRSEDASGPIVTLQTFSARFARLQNINTYALTEDFRLGPSFSVEARAASHLFGLQSDFLTLSASYADLRYFRGNLLSFGASASVRVQTGVLAGAWAVNEDLQLALREVTPKFGPFRLHIFGSLRLRGHDLSHLQLTLGSDSGLRAYPARSLRGNDRYQVNVELRTMPLNLWTIHVGGVLFYDGGDAPASLAPGAFGWKHGAGVGLRIGIPQFNRDVIRLDLAFPFEIAAGGYVPRFSAEFGQAF